MLSVATTNGTYMHVRTVDDDRRVFVHGSECDFHVDDVLKGDVIDISEITETEKGPRGRQVVWVERPAPETLPAPEPVEGTVVYIADDERKFGFLPTGRLRRDREQQAPGRYHDSRDELRGLR